MKKYEVGGYAVWQGGRGFGDRGTCKDCPQVAVAHGPSRATRARWPDLQSTASAADPLFLLFCCIALCCVAGVTGWDRFRREEQRNPRRQRNQRKLRNPTELRKPTELSEQQNPREQRKPTEQRNQWISETQRTPTE